MPLASINCSLQTPPDFTSPSTSALGAIEEIAPEFQALSQFEPEYPAYIFDLHPAGKTSSGFPGFSFFFLDKLHIDDHLLDPESNIFSDKNLRSVSALKLGTRQIGKLDER